MIVITNYETFTESVDESSKLSALHVLGFFLEKLKWYYGTSPRTDIVAVEPSRSLI